MSESWRRQLEMTVQGFDELEQQRRAILDAAVRSATDGVRLDTAPSRKSRPTLPALVAAYERNLIQWTLAGTKGNQKKAAALLGVRASSLHEKMKRLGLIRRRQNGTEGDGLNSNGTPSTEPRHL